MRRLAILSLGAALAGCGADPSVAASLANAAKPVRLPYLVACWEKELQGSPPETGFVATVDFVVEGKTSRFKEARVRSVEAAGPDGKPVASRGPSAELDRCVAAALNQSSLPTEDDSNGPGFATAEDLQVKRFRIAFVDASAKQREAASAKQANVLVGPRADRCQGLYSHDPPRDASLLYAEISRSEQQAAALHAQAGPGDRDLEARELQKTYDAKLELLERLTSDLGQPAIPEANRKKLREALDELDGSLKRTAAKIGCKR